VDNLEYVSTTPVGVPTSTSAFYYAGSVRIAMSVNGTLSYLGADALGSTTVALDTAGTVTASVLDAPYGAKRYSAGTMPTDYGYTGQHEDAITGLDYFNARYYDPVAGQFTSPDTILPDDGYNILGLSRYAYVEGNPTTRNDPSGHCPMCIGALVGAAIGAGIAYGVQVAGNLQPGPEPGQRADPRGQVRDRQGGAAGCGDRGHRRPGGAGRGLPGRSGDRGVLLGRARRGTTCCTVGSGTRGCWPRQWWGESWAA